MGEEIRLAHERLWDDLGHGTIEIVDAPVVECARRETTDDTHEVAPARRLIEGEPEPIGIRDAQVYPLLAGAGGDAPGLARHAHGDGVEKGLGLNLKAEALERERCDPCHAMGAPGDAPEPRVAVPDGIKAGDDGEQHLRRADVACRFFAADMLLARLQRHAQGGLAGAVDRNPDDAPRHRPLVDLAGGEKGGMGPAIAHGYAEALGAADGDIGPPGARRLQQREGEQIGGGNRQGARLVELLGDGREVSDLAARAGIGEEGRKNPLGRKIAQRIADDHLDAERARPCLDDADGLGVGVAINKKGIGLRFHNPPRHGHGLGGGRRFVKERGVGEL